jgi:hypothetical protein
MHPSTVDELETDSVLISYEMLMGVIQMVCIAMTFVSWPAEALES